MRRLGSQLAPDLSPAGSTVLLRPLNSSHPSTLALNPRVFTTLEARLPSKVENYARYCMEVLEEAAIDSLQHRHHRSRKHKKTAVTRPSPITLGLQ